MREFLELLDECHRSVDRIECEIVSREEMLLFAPTRVGLKNLGMTETRTVIGQHARNRCGTQHRSEAFDQRVLDQTELARAHDIPARPLPDLNNQLLFCNSYASLWLLLLLDLLDQTKRVVAGDERHVLVSAEILK